QFIEGTSDGSSFQYRTPAHLEYRGSAVQVFSAGQRGTMIRVGVIGYGYWGPNIVRNLHGLDSTRVEMICDKNPAALGRARKAYPGIRAVLDPAELLRSPDIDAVAVITPVWTHYELARMAL